MRLAPAFLFCITLLVPTFGFAQQESKVQKYPLVDVIDGDTIRVRASGRVVSLRLLNLDTEETFHDDANTQKRAKADFPAYVKQQGKGATKPTKYGTPFGEAARVYAEEFFKGVDSVEVESDHPAEKTGHFGRLLSYVFIVKDGKRLFYNVEAVRKGYSPYYTKYGRSRRFDAEFKKAEAEAKAAKLGMWGQWLERQCYPDYEARLKWWAERAKVYDAWRKRVAENDKLAKDKKQNLVDLSQVGAMSALKRLNGKSVCVFGTINRVRHPNGRNSVVVLSVKRDLIDMELGGRVNDGGRYNREICIGVGKVALQNGQVRLLGGELELPVLEVHSKGKLKANPAPPERSPRSSGSSRSGSRIQKLKWADFGKIKVQFRGKVGDIIRQISIECEVNVVYGDLPRETFDRKIRVYFGNISPGHAALACAKAANIRSELVGDDTLIIKGPRESDLADDLQAKNRRAILEIERRLLDKLVKEQALTDNEKELLDSARAVHNGLRPLK